MPWKECQRAEAKWKFVRAVLQEERSIAALCAEHGISRACGYRWWKRFRQKGTAGLAERSRQPESARRKQRRWRERLCKLRRRHPRWGVEKLRKLLQRAHPHSQVPAARTLGRWLKQAGLVAQRKRRRPAGPVVALPPPPVVRQSNDLWTMDFKGTFRVGAGTGVKPLTVRDAFSRSPLLVCDLPRADEAKVRQALTRLFQRHGLPKAIRVDLGLRPRPGGWHEVYLGPHLLGLLHPDDPAGLRPVSSHTCPSQRKGGSSRPFP